MRDKVQLSDLEIATAFNNACGDEVIDPEGWEVDDLSWTHETVEDFVNGRKSWAEPGELVSRGENHLYVLRAQARKGQRRQTVAIVDFGEYRALWML